MDRNGVIYFIKCKDYPVEYIWETGKELINIIIEH